MPRNRNLRFRPEAGLYGYNKTRTKKQSWIDGRSDVAQTLAVTLSAAEGYPR